MGARMKNVFLAMTLSAAAASGACASAIAKAPPERPALDVPAPPAKVVEGPPLESTTPEPVPDLPAAPPAARPPRTPVREAAKPEPKPEPATTEAAPPPVVMPAVPAPVLRTPNSPDAAEATKQVHDILDRASKTLNSMDARRFAKGKKDQYNQAKQLLTASEDALKKSDFENAKKLAGKAEDIANELKGR
jgi:type IV secretory pathway VirB10-like protein